MMAINEVSQDLFTLCIRGKLLNVILEKVFNCQTTKKHNLHCIVSYAVSYRYDISAYQFYFLSMLDMTHNAGMVQVIQSPLGFFYSAF